MEINEYLKQMDIPLEYSDEIQGPNTRKIYLKILKPFKLNKILSLDKELGIFYGVGDKLSINIERDKITLELPKERIYPKFEFTKTDDKLTVSIGNSYNQDIKIKLADMPHMIIAGTTGSGKSVLLRNIIKQLDYYSFIDGKTNELEEANAILDNFIAMMDRRYKLFTNLEKRLKMERGACDIDFWNNYYELETSKLHRWVVIIDEYADLVMQDKALGRKKLGIENKVIRLMQKARAAGIHVIITTQRPDAKTINGLIRANAPGRIALKTANKLESRIILDKPGAEKLLGKGDMIVQYPGFEVRCQGYA